MNERRLFVRERKSRRIFATVMFIALKYSRKHKLLSSIMLDKIQSETLTSHKTLYEDFMMLKPVLPKLLPKFEF